MKKPISLGHDAMLKECYAYDSPPVGVYNPNDKYHIKSVPNLTNERFKEPSSLLKIKKSVPLGYLQNFNTFYKSLNMSKSNLPKANRFVQRELNERSKLVHFVSTQKSNLLTTSLLVYTAVWLPKVFLAVRSWSCQRADSKARNFQRKIPQL